MEALRALASRSDLAVVDELRARVNYTNVDRASDVETHQTILFHCIEANNMASVKFLVDVCMADINVQNASGHTPLMFSLLSEAPEIALYLARHPRLSVGVKDNDGWTALTNACFYNEEAVFLALLDRIPRVEAVSEVDKIMWKYVAGFFSKSTIEKFIDKSSFHSIHEAARWHCPMKYVLRHQKSMEVVKWFCDKTPKATLEREAYNVLQRFNHDTREQLVGYLTEERGVDFKFFVHK